MKAKLFTQDGKKSSDIELPNLFNSFIREDIAQKYFEVEKFELRQAYASYDEAGKRHSASGTISHRRHEWKGHYGKGMSRLPRKIMWRRGTQFMWIGAEVSGTRGGRKSHPPQGLFKARKINKKEIEMAFNSALASTFNSQLVKKRYSSLTQPTSSAVIESLPGKTKDFLFAIKNIFTSSFDILAKKREVRAGKGKNRARKYKSNAGLLVIKSKDESVKFSGFDIKSVKEVTMKDLMPLGRLTLFTKKSLDEISKEMKK